VRDRSVSYTLSSRSTAQSQEIVFVGWPVVPIVRYDTIEDFNVDWKAE